MNLPIILLGAGGHGRVLLDILFQQSLKVLAIADPACKNIHSIENIPLIDEQAVLGYPTAEVLLVNGLGSIGDTGKRQNIYEYFKKKGFKFATIIHTSAVISPQAVFGEGVQVMAGAIVQTGATVACNSIINTKATIEHDCLVGAHVHIATGAILCGGVHVNDQAHVGAGVTIIQGLVIGKRSIIGAGAVVLKDIPPAVVAVGVPARIIKYREG
ncbi:MAG TPA: sugar acetyltransferase [Firmicutes bacterium]|nr:sugar acetyltransferase [Bacillota bacterium]